MERQFYGVFLKPIWSKSFVSSCNNTWKCDIVKPKQIYLPCSSDYLLTLLYDMTLSTRIKQTSVFCEGPIFLVLTARFTAGHFIYGVALSPAVCCQHPNRKKKDCRESKHVCTVHFDKQRTLWNDTETECSGQTEGNCGRNSFSKQAFNKTLIPFQLTSDLCVGLCSYVCVCEIQQL